MPFLLFVLIVILIAQIGFWQALAAILGAVAMIVLLAVLVIAVFVGALSMLFGSRRRYWR